MTAADPLWTAAHAPALLEPGRPREPRRVSSLGEPHGRPRVAGAVLSAREPRRFSLAMWGGCVTVPAQVLCCPRANQADPRYPRGEVA